jgi:hypothetical protein
MDYETGKEHVSLEHQLEECKVRASGSRHRPTGAVLTICLCREVTMIRIREGPSVDSSNTVLAMPCAGASVRCEGPLAM